MEGSELVQKAFQADFQTDVIAQDADKAEGIEVLGQLAE